MNHFAQQSVLIQNYIGQQCNLHVQNTSAANTTTKTPKTQPQEHQKHHHKNTKRNKWTITPLFSTMACKLAGEFLCLYRELSTCKALKRSLCNYKDISYYVEPPSKPRKWMSEWHLFYHHLVEILGSHMRFPCCIMSHHVPSTVLWPFDNFFHLSSAQAWTLRGGK